MSRDLPARPSVEHLRKQAKDLLRDFQQGTAAAVERLRSLGSRTAGARPRLADAQHVVAREYGFATWSRLKDHVESLAPPADPMEALAAAIQANDVEQAADVLRRHPELKSRLNDPMPGGHFGATPLLAALPSGNGELIDVLLRAGADINARSHWWAGSFGVLDGDHGLTSFLIERGAIVDAHAAARLGMMERLEELVSARPDLVHSRGGDGQTPLHFASTVDVATFLLERGADIDARDVDHESTPAQWMVRDRQTVARFLIERGCLSDILLAAALGDLPLVRKHLDADPDCVRTSVSETYFPKRNPRAGGTIYIWTLGQSKTAHLVAREFGHEHILGLLMQRSPEELKLSTACELGDEGLFKALLTARPGLVQTLSDDDRRKLVSAAQNNNTQAVRLMLGAGWPVDARGQHGATALHFAAWHGDAVMVREILKHHPPLETRDDDFGGTPLRWAFHGSEKSEHRETGDYAGTVLALLEAGAEAPELTPALAASEAVRDVLRSHVRTQAGG